MRTYTFLELATEILLQEGKAMTVREIWESAQKLELNKKLKGQNGLTPINTLNAVMNRNYEEKPQSFFLRDSSIRPYKFSLKDLKKATEYISAPRQSDLQEKELLDSEDIEAVTPKRGKGYLERDIHDWVVNFAEFRFNAYLKTISHNESSKKTYGEWIHPDLVGYWFPFSEYEREVLEMFDNGIDLVRFYSFELKRELSRKNLRESFFQAVSNSSWSNEGYLVAAEISEAEDFLEELKRLSSSFGIGIIRININNPERGEIVFPARKNPAIDWQTVSKLASMNPDFQKFLADVKKDVSGSKKRPGEENYDKRFPTSALIERAKKL